MGVQKQLWKNNPPIVDRRTIQGLLEYLAKQFRSDTESSVYVSSRTDTGVHAIRSSAHLDILKPWNPDDMLKSYNRYFMKHDLDIRLHSCQVVPETFHARHGVKSRTYLYRLAVRRPDAPLYKCPLSQMLLAELKRCYFIQNPTFDIRAVRLAMSLFLGENNFRTFAKIRKLDEEEGSAPPTVRTIFRFEIEPGTPMLSSLYSPNNSHYDFWNIICEARSFLNKQVRRMVGVVVAVAQGRVSVDTVRHMLDCPSPDSWDPRAKTAPSFGLYLADISYDPQDLFMPNTIPGEQLEATVHDEESNS